MLRRHAQDNADSRGGLDMNRRRLVFACAVVCAATLSLAARAAVFVPTKVADSADGACDTDCSLREAVLAANAHAGEDVVLLHTGTYVLSIAGTEDAGAAGDLDVLDDLLVLGDGATRTIVDGGAIDRILQVPSGVAVELVDLTLRNGLSSGNGGAVLNAGDLTIRRAALRSNRATAGGGGPGAGGALFSDGPGSVLTVAESALLDNRALDGGGGIAVGGAMTLVNATLAGNRSEGDSGGGIYFVASSQATVNNATISGNVAALGGGGAFAELSAFIGFAPKIVNSILAGNSAPTHPDCSGDFDSGYDLVGVGTGCNGPSAANHDLVGTATSPLDARLEALQTAGGQTPTFPLRVPAAGAASPAIDAGNPAASGSGGDACAAVDQRAARRPGSSRCDIGAFEVTAACVPGGPFLCLNNGRFQVTASFVAPSGTPGQAQGVTLTTDSGYFWFVPDRLARLPYSPTPTGTSPRAASSTSSAVGSRRSRVRRRSRPTAPSFHSSRISYTVGMTSRVSSVEVRVPPMTARPSGARQSAPSP
jgi:CSLREA domain-containing protein